MIKLTIQMGHVARTRGATGTVREQEAARSIATVLAAKASAAGISTKVVGADDAIPDSDIFIALHTDGSADPNRRGASVGYPDAAGGRLAGLWKEQHRTLSDQPWNNDNFTTNLRQYYGFRKSKARVRFLAEHWTATNPGDQAWGFANIDAIASAHLRAIQAFVGGAAPVNAPAVPSIQTPPPGVAPTLLAVDGIFGWGTIRRLQQSINRTGGHLVEDGDFGPKTVAGLQARLNHLRTVANRLSGVAIDGELGPQTVRALQWRVATPQDGKWGPLTTSGLQRLLNREEL